MRWRFAEIQGRYQERTGKKITYREITAATGLSPDTLSGISTGRIEQAAFGTLEKLLAFFSARLGEELTTNDLLEYLPDEPARPPSFPGKLGRTTIRPVFHVDPDEEGE